ncbi:MAG: GNAT family N-acetyltransferase [Proteobacteria bacterium]|nr:GNAT family N-acetyltransferase [Pseudomonadota bacterium]
MTTAPLPTGLDIEAIERATLDAVAPQWVEALDDEAWLLPMDHGTIGRARSAVPLRHEAPRTAPGHLLERMEARYAARGLPTQLRVAHTPCFDALADALAARGYESGKPTLTQTGTSRAMLVLGAGAPAEVDAAPDAAWAQVFLGPGFDPVDGASRVQALSRAGGNLFASVRESGSTLAAGAISFSHGWASVHGMRTVQSARGRGLAGRVLAGLAQAALYRGFERVFLQVEAGNAPALALYRRAGFTTAWTYRYWQRPAPN